MLGNSPRAPLRVLVVQDEPNLSNALSYILVAGGYEVMVDSRGEEALRIIPDFHPDLVLLDIILPDLSGLEVCRQIRASTATLQPVVVMLTAQTGESDRVAAFEVGADDFVTKPFSLRELMLRIQVRLRAREPGEPTAGAEAAVYEKEDERQTLGPLEIDPLGHRAFLSGKEISVSVQEMRLLTYLAKVPGKLCTRKELLAEVWGYQPEVSSRTLDTHIKRLRDKFGTMALMIQTVHGVGYRLAEPQHRSRRYDSSGSVLRRR